MIIQALKDYYDRKAQSSGIAKLGWEYKEIKYIIVLDESGTVVDLQNTQEGTSKDKRVHVYLVPQGVKRTVGVASNLLWDNAEYVLGMTLKEGKKSKDGRNPGEVKHEAFCDRLESLGDLPDPGLIAVRHFVKLSLDEKLEQLRKCSEFENLEKDGTAVNISFKLVGETELVVASSEVQKRIDELSASSDSTPKGVCLITGQEDAIANLHPAIKGIYDGNATGTNIVGFNLAAFCSFGKKQGANAPIGESTVFAYTTALNTLLGKDSNNKMLVGKTSMVFWSEKPSRLEQNLKQMLSDPEKKATDTQQDSTEQSEQTDEIKTKSSKKRTKQNKTQKDNPDAGIEAIHALMKSPFYGNPAEKDSEHNYCFYVLGLTPNSARLAIQFWIVGTVGDMEESLRTYFRELELVHSPFDREYPSINSILVSVLPPSKQKKEYRSNIEGDLMRAVFDKNLPYPRTLFDYALIQTRTQGDRHPRMAILKAYLNRKLRLDNKNNSHPSTEKEITVSLDTTNTNVGYCLGRLFATLEKIQGEANPGLNATIRDRFYGAASGTPITVFPNLIRLMTHHLSKMENKGRVVNFEKLIGEILDNVNDFPATLSMEDQGRFALGYYHQKNVFYTAKDSNKDEDNTQTK